MSVFVDVPGVLAAWRSGAETARPEIAAATTVVRAVVDGVGPFGAALGSATDRFAGSCRSASMVHDELSQALDSSLQTYQITDGESAGRYPKLADPR